MSDARPNGLASLTAQRDRARRSMPPPRHPASALPPSPSPGDGGGPTHEAAAQPSVLTRVAADGTPAAAPASRAPGIGAPVKVTLYVDRDSDEFMEAARVEGLVARPKVDISRSAVVRLALRRLMGEMTPAEVRTLLERQDVHNVGPGRKRR